jgi:hypothetical protein
MSGGKLCSFCGEKPGVAFADIGDVACCGACARPHGPLMKLAEDAKAARLPNYDSDRRKSADDEARRVGLANDDTEVPDEAMALSLLDVFYPRASESSRAAHYPTILSQLKFQRTRAAGRQQATQLSTTLDKAARHAGLIPTSEVAAMVARAGFKTTTVPPRKSGSLAKAEIAAAVRRVGLAG